LCFTHFQVAGPGELLLFAACGTHRHKHVTWTCPWTTTLMRTFSLVTL
jgi:hypothetical protein